MSRLTTLFHCTVSFLIAGQSSDLSDESLDGSPNLLIIFVDDLGYGDLGCCGNRDIETLNIDRLAREDQRWTNFCASGAVCTRSRWGLMSGRHAGLIGDLRFVDIWDQLRPAMLKRQGYAKASLGKWYFAGCPEAFTKSALHPLECGFDYQYGTPGSNDVPVPVGKRQTRDVFDEADKLTF